VIANANRQGAYLRSSPGGAVIAALSEGTLVILLGEQVEAGGRMWAHVQSAGRPDGWLAAAYLAPISTQPSEER
jgi:hypothetical protein